MDNKPNRSITPYTGGFLPEIGLRIKLILKLLGDRRVNIFLKAIPVASLVYLVFPDLAIGPVDDALVIWLASNLFVELCPDEVVEEHLKKLHHVNLPGETADPVPPASSAESKMDVVDAEFQDVDEE
ncbi:hypothetical protein [Leptolinea tardivitalis]|uniref:DUF1232 domain-containing protein n=1 Tax=Leptolinea tardivitalis TaxID=229920 RepID=A0A0P6XAK7_9CHLR|nr:hypothetical protein [Leptolinea tardivitalis]KPL71653.1 hypothetical protein ADM99_09250 [Leptolinea tardivitalis]GAP19988.1 hypothetical protein LTAR_00172 [Leptolinea tardivitalis]